MYVCLFVYVDHVFVRLEKYQRAILHFIPATLLRDLPLVATKLPPTPTTTTPMGRWGSWSGVLLLVSSGSWREGRGRGEGGKREMVSY